jgi:hypothetical protein
VDGCETVLWQGIVRSINGEELYEWKEIKRGGTSVQKFVLKPEYVD